jgi:hypothetical protein
MTQTEHLMASITTHGHDIAALLARPDRAHMDGWCGAIQTLRAEREIKRDLLARMCEAWFKV